MQSNEFSEEVSIYLGHFTFLPVIAWRLKFVQWPKFNQFSMSAYSASKLILPKQIFWGKILTVPYVQMQEKLTKSNYSYTIEVMLFQNLITKDVYICVTVCTPDKFFLFSEWNGWAMGIIIKGGWENVLLPDDNGPRSCFPKGQHLYTVASLWRPNRGQRSTFSLSGSTQNEDGTSLISSLLICWGCSSTRGCYKVKRIMFFCSVANFDYLHILSTMFRFGSWVEKTIFKWFVHRVNCLWTTWLRTIWF